MPPRKRFVGRERGEEKLVANMIIITIMTDPAIATISFHLSGGQEGAQGGENRAECPREWPGELAHGGVRSGCSLPGEEGARG